MVTLVHIVQQYMHVVGRRLACLVDSRVSEVGPVLRLRRVTPSLSLPLQDLPGVHHGQQHHDLPMGLRCDRDLSWAGGGRGRDGGGLG